MRCNYPISGYNFTMNHVQSSNFLCRCYSTQTSYAPIYLNLYITVCLIKKISIANVLFVMEIWVKVPFLSHSHYL